MFSWLCGHGGSLSGSSRMEGFGVGEHAMHDHGKLACQSHLGFAHTGAPGDPHRPTFKGRATLDRLGQHDVGSLIERLAHRSIADLADSAGAVGLA